MRQKQNTAKQKFVNHQEKQFNAPDYLLFNVLNKLCFHAVAYNVYITHIQ